MMELIIYIVEELIVTILSLVVILLLAPVFFKLFRKKLNKALSIILAIIVAELIAYLGEALLDTVTLFVLSGHLYNVFNFVGSNIPVIGHLLGAITNFKVGFSSIGLFSHIMVTLYVVQKILVALLQLIIFLFEIIFILKSALDSNKAQEITNVKTKGNDIYSHTETPYVYSLYHSDDKKDYEEGKEYKTQAGAYSYDQPKVDISDDIIRSIRKFKQLYDSGAITKEEYDKVKKNLLGL